MGDENPQLSADMANIAAAHAAAASQVASEAALAAAQAQQAEAELEAERERIAEREYQAALKAAEQQEREDVDEAALAAAIAAWEQEMAENEANHQEQIAQLQARIEQLESQKTEGQHSEPNASGQAPTGTPTQVGQEQLVSGTPAAAPNGGAPAAGAGGNADGERAPAPTHFWFRRVGGKRPS